MNWRTRLQTNTFLVICYLFIIVERKGGRGGFSKSTRESQNMKPYTNHLPFLFVQKEKKSVGNKIEKHSYFEWLLFFMSRQKNMFSGWVLHPYNINNKSFRHVKSMHQWVGWWKEIKKWRAARHINGKQQWFIGENCVGVKKEKYIFYKLFSCTYFAESLSEIIRQKCVQYWIDAGIRVGQNVCDDLDWYIPHRRTIHIYRLEHQNNLHEIKCKVEKC